MTNTMRNISSVFCSFLSDESGQDLIEYALVAAIIALGAIVAMTGLATTISRSIYHRRNEADQRALTPHKRIRLVLCSIGSRAISRDSRDDNWQAVDGTR